jgi:hypothetical protein
MDIEGGSARTKINGTYGRSLQRPIVGMWTKTKTKTEAIFGMYDKDEDEDRGRIGM